ncbi:MAG TPA: TIGR03936 family radical SAM-associated protein [Syntrophomonadaceae bacterium]|nr:TIGR03936 family radical SAM-associated protein [Syntrophomonadaceae bacterium]
MRLRAEYEVGPNHRFLANLEMMHVMERALRRAGIPYHLSEGFNPHIRISMGTVLPVGIWGKKEYFDLEMDPMDGAEFLRRMNQVLPPGIAITACRSLGMGARALMKSINAAEYAFQVNQRPAEVEAAVQEIISQEEILVPSRGKKKNVNKNLRPGLFALNVVPQGDIAVIKALVSVNEPLNIRFDELLDLLAKFGISRESIVEFWREGNYIKQGEQLLSPLVTP